MRLPNSLKVIWIEYAEAWSVSRAYHSEKTLQGSFDKAA